MNNQISDKNRLSLVNPDISSEWDYKKNYPLTPNDFAANSNIKVWWTCTNGHNYSMVIQNRNKGRNCHYCSGKIAHEENCFATKHPELLKEWHPTKNGSLSPYTILEHSEKEIYWLCKNGHAYTSLLDHRYKGCNCPYCSGHKACLDNCLATLRPDISIEWHPTKNGSLTPNDVTVSSGKKVWWLCKDCGHEYIKKIVDQSKFRVCKKCYLNLNSLSIKNPELAKKWHPTKNGTLTPNDISWNSHKKVWWLCKDCGHEYIKSTKGQSRCSKCYNCISLLMKNPKLASEWHPTKNGKLLPKDFEYNSIKKVWWLCKDCGHEYIKSINERNSYERFAHGNCENCYLITNSLSIKNPELAKKWHPTKNGTLTPNDVTYSSTKKVWWLCKDCGHEYIKSITNQNACYCNYCISLIFKNPELCKEWHPTKNGSLTPDKISANSNKKVWWLCKNGHEYKSNTYGRNNGLDNTLP